MNLPHFVLLGEKDMSTDIEHIANEYEAIGKNVARALEFVSGIYDEETGDTRAHIMARSGFAFGEPNVLRLTNLHGETVLDCMAQCGHVLSDEAFYLRVIDIAYRPLAHAVKRGYIFTDKQLLSLCGFTGLSIAHIQASEGYFFTDPEILQLLSNDGISVADIVYKVHPTRTIATIH